MPTPENLKITQSSMLTAFGMLPTILIPFKPVQAPSIVKPLIVTTSVVAATLMTMALTPAERIPASVPVPSIVIDLVMVTAPKPPGSRTLISPQAAVLEIAPANVLQGAVRLHGLASSPTPDTQVRVACAWAIDAKANMKIAIAISLMVNRNLFIWSLLFSVEVWGWPPVEHGSVPATVAESSHVDER